MACSACGVLYVWTMQFTPQRPRCVFLHVLRYSSICTKWELTVVYSYLEASPPQRRLLRSEDPRQSVLPERPNDAADGRRGRRVMATDGTRAWQLNGRCRGDLHPVHTVRRRVIIMSFMTRAPCRCSASPSFSFRPAALLLHNHHRRSWHDLGTPGDGLRASCWTEAYAYRASLICGPVLLLRACILCGVCVSVVNISLIGVIYGSGGSVHLTLAHRQKLAVAHRSRPRNASSLRS